MKAKKKRPVDDLRPEYDFDYSKAVRGKYCRKLIDQRFSRCFKRHGGIRAGTASSFEFEFQADAVQPRERLG